MKPTAISACRKQRGVALILSMIFVLVFSALAASMATISGVSAQVASNQHKCNLALAAAESGIECAKYLVSTVSLPETGHNFVTEAEAHEVWGRLCDHLCSSALDGKAVPAASRFSDPLGSGDQIAASDLNFGSVNTDFTLRFYRYDGDPHTVLVRSIGANDEIARQVNIEMEITSS